MKKIISAALAVAACMGTFASCSNKKDGKKDGKLSAKGKSEYVSILSLDGDLQPIMESIDKGINYSMNRAREFEDEEYNPCVIKFSDDKFVMSTGMTGRNTSYYDGTFVVKDGAVKFSYENYISWDNNGDIEKINVDQEFEDADKDVIKKDIADNMQKMNKTGAYCRWAVPAMCSVDKWKDHSILPFIRFIKFSNYSFYDPNDDIPNTLKTVDDLLCTDTYGIELKGKYSRGKAFTLEHNFEETMEDDEQSPLKWDPDAEEYKVREEERAVVNYGCDSLNSTIEFSDGEWEWFNDDGELLNNGKYDESKDHPGLISMYVDDDSKKSGAEAQAVCPLLFYIADDGEIYYPAFVKMK